MASSTPISLSRNMALRLLLFLGLVLSVLSLYHHVGYVEGYFKGESFCTISNEFNCEAVNASAWSSFLGIPIASYGLFYYTIALGLVSLAPRRELFSPTQLRGILYLWTFLGVCFSIVLFGISKFMIGVLCPLCLATYVVNGALFGLVAIQCRKDGIWKSVRNGANAFLSVLARFRTGNGSALRVLLFVAFAVALMVLSQPLMMLVISFTSGRPEGDVSVVRQADLWEQAPVFSFQLDHSGGMYGDFSKGDQNAPIQIVEFADIECPGCRKLYSDMKALLQRYEGLYSFTFKNYPLDHACNPTIARPFHRHACKAAMFTRCAGEQGRFWEALDAVFSDPIVEHTQSEEAVHKTLVSSIGGGLGLDVIALESCMQTARYQSRIVADIREGKRAGLYVTPSVWVNGRRITPLSKEELERVFAKILSERGITIPANKP